MASIPIIEGVAISKTYRQHTMPMIRLQDALLFWRHRAQSVQIHALKPISFKINAGEWVGLYGPNGSGKTTFLKILAGILLPDTGTVRIGGSLSSFFELGIGFHSERPARKNIRVNGMLSGMHAQEIDAFTERVLAFADIGEHADLPMKCYSTGMQLRLGFAAAAQMEADIYLFDEILAVGDKDFQLKCHAYLRELKAKGKTVIIVSHDYHTLRQLCGRMMFFDKGLMSGQRRKIQTVDDPAAELFVSDDDMTSVSMNPSHSLV